MFKKVYLGLIIGIVFCVSPVFAEEITITTYYPSPYGSYSQLQTNTLGVGDNNDSLSLDSGDVPNATTNPGDVWIKGKVGIGTTTPQSTLHVVGRITAVGLPMGGYVRTCCEGTATIWTIERIWGVATSSGCPTGTTATDVLSVHDERESTEWGGSCPGHLGVHSNQMFCIGN